MRWSDIPRDPPRSTLRWFAVFWIVFTVSAAGWQFFSQDDALAAVVLLGLALIGVVGVFSPARIRPVFVSALMLTFPLNWLVSHVILAVLYYCIFTPLGLFFRWTGRDALGFRGPSEQDTYWKVKPGVRDIRSYFRQS